MKNIILASSSPQRKRLLTQMGYKFKAIPSEYEERWDKTKTIKENAKLFAWNKALDIFEKHKNSIVIGCDTFVVHPENGVYLKPKDKNEAKKMLKSYSNETIEVISGISVISSTFERTKCLKTKIIFSKIEDDEIEWWLGQNEWQGRSGAFSIEGATMCFVKGVKGCFFNIIGLPTQVLSEILKSMINEE